MALSTSGGIDLVPNEYREVPALAVDQDFICQNPDSGSVIYVVYSDTQPLPNFEGAEVIFPHQFYGRENAADTPVKQGKPWFRASNPLQMPLRK